MRKILVAITGSKRSLKTIEYCGRQFSGMSDLSLTLLHVLPGVPALFWDDGHILSEGEKAERRRVVEKWLENKKLATQPMFRSAMEILTKEGIKPEQIETKTIDDAADPATGILEEARNGGYLTLVIGRSASSRVAELLLGNTTISIIHRGAGLAICVVE